MQFRILWENPSGTAGALAELGPPKQRAVLAILLPHVGNIRPHGPAHRPAVGRQPAADGPALGSDLHLRFRKTLEPLGGDRLIVTRPPGYELDVDADAIDARRFERLIGKGLAGSRPASATKARPWSATPWTCGEVRHCPTLPTTSLPSPRSVGCTTCALTASKHWPRASWPSAGRRT